MCAGNPRNRNCFDISNQLPVHSNSVLRSPSNSVLRSLGNFRNDLKSSALSGILETTSKKFVESLFRKIQICSRSRSTIIPTRTNRNALAKKFSGLMYFKILYEFRAANEDPALLRVVYEFRAANEDPGLLRGVAGPS